jgi:microcystin-dependent protein
MSNYNVVDRASLQDRQPEDISKVLANFDAIAAIINGQLDGTNLKADAALHLSQLAQDGASVGDIVRWDGTKWAPAGAGGGGGLTIPAGLILDYGGPTAPSGWLICDGAAISRTSFADLFSAIGTTWGVGDGVNTFNLPDLQQRVTVGSGPNALGTTDGVTPASSRPGTNHTHTTPNHQHALSSHNHLVNQTDTVFDLGNEPRKTFVVPGYTDMATGDTTLSGAGITSANGSSYAVVHKIIKT